jgi:hypothetical protein
MMQMFWQLLFVAATGKAHLALFVLAVIFATFTKPLYPAMQA